VHPDSEAPAPTGSVAATGTGAWVPGYDIIRELGRGGMGVVYQARQRKLNRPVALKMILAGSHTGAADLGRFQTEAESIARLRHPNIVQVYEVGEHDGKPFFSLEFCGGGSLEKKLGGTPLPAREAAALVETLARAMQAAHEQRVIHRDLKPANVLLAEDGTPKITDFGLAKKLDEAGQTQSGVVMGTPSYMAPEQACGKSADIGPLADVYALGAVLYECLTGRPPFKAATALETIMQVASDEPVPPSRLQPKTPADLETICLKCLHKEVRKRYASARELADDLRHFLGGEPIRARPVGRAERAAKWVRRNPVVAALLAAVVLSLLGGAGGIFVKYQDAIDALSARDAALKQARDDAEAARQANREAQYQLAISNVLLAQAAWNENHVAEARERLELVPPDLRRWEWYYLSRQYQGGIFMLEGHNGSPTGVAFSPDGTRLATGGDTARAWDARTGRLLLECRRPAPRVLSAVYSPDGTRLATVGEDKRARLWDARTGEPILELKGATGVRCVAFSPDATRLATAGEDRAARLWDARTGQEVLKYEGHTDFITGVAYSPDGARLATASLDATARLWDTRTGRELLKCEGQTGHLQSIAFSPDGKWLLTGGHDRTAQLWDVRTGRFLQEFKGHTDVVWSVAFSPDGTRVATASWDHTARLWAARTGQPLLECKGHTDFVTGVAFSPDGARVATASDDGSVRMWDARTRQPLLECVGHAGVAFSPDGARLATAGEDHTARLWNARTGQFLRECKGHAGTLWGVAFSPDGARLATASGDGSARMWDARTGQYLLKCKGHTGEVWGVTLSPDGAWVATASADKTARLWDARTGQQLLKYDGHTDGVTGVAFSPDGARLATASGDRKGLDWIESSDRTARLWDARTGQQLLEFKGHTGGVTGVVFSPDGARVATASADHTARVCDAQTGQLLLVCKGHTEAVTSVAFSPDGARLATGSRDNTARVWDVRTGQSLVVCKGHAHDIVEAPGEVLSVAFSPDGTRLATANADGTVRLRDARRWPLPPDEELEYRLWVTRPEPGRHREQFHEYKDSDRFAAAFHLDRYLAYRLEERAILLDVRTRYLEETLKQDAQDAAARLRLARTAWHDPALGPQDADALIPSADETGLLQRRTRAGLLMRQHKAAEAVAVLGAALRERGNDRPPAEELLLAWAYLDTKQPDRAREQWAKATAWLDRGQEAMRAANVAVALAAGAIPGAVALLAPAADPRYDAFDWETWHEIDVLRRELAPRFEVKQP
jgi:WD40 repeat protein/tRNA A-37 threonylcarbamoyl transferase component Bud32